MTIDEFLSSIQQTERFYQKEYSEEQRQVWFSNVKRMSIQRFNYIMSRLYKTNKFLPKLSDFIEENNATPSNNQITTKIDCDRCNGTGYVRYFKVLKGHKYEYMATCSCKQKHQYKGWEVTEPRNKSNYYMKNIEELEGIKN